MAAGKGKSDQEISLPCQRVGAHINRWGWVDHFQFSLTLSLTHMHAHTDTCTQGETVPLSYHKYSSCQDVSHGLGTRLMGWSYMTGRGQSLSATITTAHARMLHMTLELGQRMELVTQYMATHTHQGVLLLLPVPEHCCCPPRGPLQPPPVFSMWASQTSPPERRRRADTHTTLYMYTISWVRSRNIL